MSHVSQIVHKGNGRSHGYKIPYLADVPHMGPVTAQWLSVPRRHPSAYHEGEGH